MKMVMQAGKYGAPEGQYLARFTGANPTTGQFGDGIEWQFEIVEGPYKGKVCSRTTALAPTLKNSCGKMLSRIVGRALRQDESADVAEFVGRLYQIEVGPKQSGSGTRVSNVMQARTSAPTAPAPQSTNGAAPPPPRQAPRPAAERTYWVEQPGGHPPLVLTAPQLAARIAGEGLDPATLYVCPQDDSAAGWKPANQFGFRSSASPAPSARNGTPPPRTPAASGELPAERPPWLAGRAEQEVAY